jgi:hypothetical protein
MREKRKFVRIDKSALVEIRELKFPVKKKNYVSVDMKNISGSGLLFRSEEAYGIGTILHLKVALTGAKRNGASFGEYPGKAILHPVSVIGKVVRVEEIEHGLSYDIGIKFLDFYQNDAAALIDFINKI